MQSPVHSTMTLHVTSVCVSAAPAKRLLFLTIMLN